MTRLGIIHYTNVAPLLHSLPRELEGLDVTWQRGVPTQVNAALLNGEVNLANISAFEFIQHAHALSALPDFSISVLGPVYSVNLFHTVPWAELEGCTIAVTTHSATSVKLLETLLRLDGIHATLERAEGVNLDELLRRYPAVLLIGDAALTEWYRVCGPISETTQMFRLPNAGRLEDGSAVTVTDLAMSWYEHTGLPFVFAVWATPADTKPDLEVVLGMRRARRTGIGHLAEVASLEATRLGLPERIVQHYLWNFRYHFEAPDRAGLRRFAELVSPENLERLRFWDV
ncbi:MAG: menaquinone biosynthesis protein [Pleurocapsa sp. SU_196_0]|nr:menaquinone biosynthesis protein [Pleurocapsa sp. SU_196_0]